MYQKIIKKGFIFIKKNGYIYEIFVAFLKNQILGNLSIWGFRNFINENGVNISSYAKKNKIYVQELIKDEIVKYCFKNDIKYYDLSGLTLIKMHQTKKNQLNFLKKNLMVKN